MKDQVEKALGMTIEEYQKLCDEIDKQYAGTEIEWGGDPIHNLSFEELDFFADYTRDMPSYSEQDLTPKVALFSTVKSTQGGCKQFAKAISNVRGDMKDLIIDDFYKEIRELAEAVGFNHCKKQGEKQEQSEDKTKHNDGQDKIEENDKRI